jgi:hypothetical protein
MTLFCGLPLWGWLAGRRNKRVPPPHISATVAAAGAPRGTYPAWSFEVRLLLGWTRWEGKKEATTGTVILQQQGLSSCRYRYFKDAMKFYALKGGCCSARKIWEDYCERSVTKDVEGNSHGLFWDILPTPNLCISGSLVNIYSLSPTVTIYPTCLNKQWHLNLYLCVSYDS